MIHDDSNRQAFDGMRQMKLPVRNLELNVAVIDHIVSSLPGRAVESHLPGIERIHALRENTRQFDMEIHDVNDPRQGIVHVLAPEAGFTMPGVTFVCGDSHTAPNGALGAIAWGIGDRNRPVENRWVGQRMPDPDVDLATFAGSQGAVGIGPPRNLADVDAGIREGVEALKAGKVCLIDLHIDPEPTRTVAKRMK